MKNYITLYADEFNRDTWEGYCCAAGVPTSATSITVKFDESDVEYEDGSVKEYEVPETVASRIRTVKDLNDFYAYVERFGDEYNYSWPIEDLDRIEDMMDDLNYYQGEYDEENVDRIFNGEEDA